ncbi:MAG: esterase-like activity of phytase family protein [Bacteroidaceae bacterium]|nr:esterase-like activity of phytase family protein [Bacteroidaceae bacterium]
MGRWKVEGANYSGIAYLGDNKYAVVNDKDRADGFYVFNIDLDSITGKVKNVEIVSKPSVLELINAKNGLSLRDAEGVAYVSDVPSVFISGEGDQRVLEYSLDGCPTGRELKVPSEYSLEAIYPNYGFEALTYSKHDKLLWTVTEHTVKADGKKSGYGNITGCKLQLLAFSPVSCKMVSSVSYMTDVPTSKKKPRNYAFGVSAMAALDDGKLLILEREFFVARRFIGSFVKNKIYCVDPYDFDSNGIVKKRLVADFKTKFNITSRSLANYEGMCLGPHLENGRQTLILLSDSQNNFGKMLYHMKDFIRVVIL